MLFHLKEEDFKKFIGDMSKRINIDADIIEKDYYVCTVLKELAEKQEYLKAYFKGGTAVYKILDTMNRFSEDIDLTVEVVKGDSNNSNKTRLKKSALGYKIPGLVLDKDKTKDVKQSVTAYYKYFTFFENEENQLHRAGEIQIEATSFTVSEPTELHIIEPILYKYANEKEREILTKEFDIKPFEIKVQKLERIFVDKLFAAQLYFEKQMYVDLSKHLYDLTILFKTKRIKDLFNNEEEFEKIVKYKRKEEIYRKGGVDKNIQIKDFGYFNMEYNDDLLKAFKLMQDKYIFKDEYRITMEESKEVLNELKDMIINIEK
jgi:predicted nucleotidyltransferase component of viral defense system